MPGLFVNVVGLMEQKRREERWGEERPRSIQACLSSLLPPPFSLLINSLLSPPSSIRIVQVGVLALWLFVVCPSVVRGRFFGHPGSALAIRFNTDSSIDIDRLPIIG